MPVDAKSTQHVRFSHSIHSHSDATEPHMHANNNKCIWFVSLPQHQSRFADSPHSPFFPCWFERRNIRWESLNCNSKREHSFTYVFQCNSFGIVLNNFINICHEQPPDLYTHTSALEVFETATTEKKQRYICLHITTTICDALALQLFYAPNNRAQTEWRRKTNKNQNQNYNQRAQRRMERRIKMENSSTQCDSRHTIHSTLDYNYSVDCVASAKYLALIDSDWAK